MRGVSYVSPIAAILREVIGWKNSNQWSRETVTQQVVDAHRRIGAESRVNVRFSDSSDAPTRQKNDADRLFRWLHDDDNDRNLLSVNLLPSLIAALPRDRALSVLNEILNPAGFAARTLDLSHAGDITPHELVQQVVRVNHRTEADAADLLDGIDPGELPRLHASLTNDIAVKKSLVSAVEASMRKTGEISAIGEAR